MRIPILIPRAAAAIMMLLASAAPTWAGGDLVFANRAGHTSPDLIKKFEAETGVSVTLDTYESDETLLAKLKSGSAGYDVVVVSSDFVPIFAKEGVIQKVDASKMPGYDNIEDRWKSPVWDKDNLYTIPFHWGVTSFSYNSRDVKEPADSLKLLFDPPDAMRGKVGMLGSPSEVIALAEAYLGMPPCQTDSGNMKKVSDLLEKQFPLVKLYSSDGVIERQASGETSIHQAWNGDAARVRLQNPDVRFSFPKEGVAGWMDNVAVPVGAKNPDNAKLFAQFLLKPENSAMSSNFTRFASAIKGAEDGYDDTLKSAPELNVPAGEKIAFTPACPEAATKLMDGIWARLKK